MNPYKITEPTCISFSGGRTSAYMLYRILQAHDMSLPPDTYVCFANTGKEHESTLDFVNACETNWKIKIHWLEYIKEKPRFKEVDYQSCARNGEPFAAMIEARSFLPNSVMRFCTTELKIKPIDYFMKSLGYDEFQSMMGIRADEPKRIVKLRETVIAPLASDNIMQKDVQDFWASNPFDLGLEYRNKVTALGNCDLCFMKGIHQIVSIVRQEPNRAIWWAEQEKKIGGRFSKDRPDYSSMYQFSQDQEEMFHDEETVACFCGD